MKSRPRTARGRKPGRATGRHVPHLRHRVLRGLGRAEHAVEEDDRPTASPKPLPGERVRDVLADLLAEDGELRQRAADHAVGDVPVADEPEHGHEDQQRREDREEAVVGELRGERAAAVVAELLRHRERERGGPEALLQGVDPSQEGSEVRHPRVLPALAPQTNGRTAQIEDHSRRVGQGLSPEVHSEELTWTAR